MSSGTSPNRFETPLAPASPVSGPSAESFATPTSLTTPDFFYDPLHSDVESNVADIEESLFETSFAKVQVFDEDLALLQSQIGRKTRIAYYDGWCAVLRVPSPIHGTFSVNIGMEWSRSVRDEISNPNWETTNTGSSYYKYDRECDVPACSPADKPSSSQDPPPATVVLTHFKELDYTFSISSFEDRECSRQFFKEENSDPDYTEEDIISENFDAERRWENEQRRVANWQSDTSEGEGENEGEEGAPKYEGSDYSSLYSQPPAVGIQVADSNSSWTPLVDASLALSGERAAQVNALLTISVITNTVNKKRPPALCVDLYVPVAIDLAYPDFVYRHSRGPLPDDSSLDTKKVYYRHIKGKSEVKKLKNGCSLIGEVHAPEEVQHQDAADFVRVLRLSFDTNILSGPPCGLRLPLEVYGQEPLPDAFKTRTATLCKRTIAMAAARVKRDWRLHLNERETERRSRKRIKEAESLEELLSNPGGPIIVTRWRAVKDPASSS